VDLARLKYRKRSVGRSAISLALVKRTLNKQKARLLSYPRVLYVGIGEKRVAGMRTGRLSIRVIVSRKGGHLPQKASLPRKVAAVGDPKRRYIPIDVDEGPKRGSLRLLGPVEGGQQVIGKEQGSLGIALLTTTGGKVLLTNAHVVLGIDEAADSQAVTNLAGEEIATVATASLLSSQAGAQNRMDAAALIPLDDVDVQENVIKGEPQKLGGIQGIRPPDAEQFFYASNTGQRELSLCESCETKWDLTFPNGSSLSFSGFWVFSVVNNGVSLPVQGDSGSAVFSLSGNNLILRGLLFAGSGDHAAVYSIDDVLTALGMS
jgi:hypothetical protein